MVQKLEYDLLSVVNPIPLNVSENFSEFDRLMNEANNAWNRVSTFKEKVENILEHNHEDSEEALVRSTVILLANLVIVQKWIEDFNSQLIKMNQKLESERGSN